MISLINIDRQNLNCDQKVVPAGSVQWFLHLQPILYGQNYVFSNPIDLFTDVVLLGMYESFEQTFTNELVKLVSVRLTLTELNEKLYNYKNADDVVRFLLSEKQPLLAAQYLIHERRLCDFLDPRYCSMTVVYASCGHVTDFVNLQTFSINKSCDRCMHSNVLKLFTSLDNTILYASKIVPESGRKFVAKCTLPFIKSTIPEILSHFEANLKM